MTQHDQLVSLVAKALRDYDTNADWSRKTFEGMARAALAAIREGHVVVPRGIMLDALKSSPEVYRLFALLNGVRAEPDRELAEILREVDHGAQRVAEGGEK